MHCVDFNVIHFENCLQSALSSLEDIKQSMSGQTTSDKQHRDRAGQQQKRQFPLDRHVSFMGARSMNHFFSPFPMLYFLSDAPFHLHFWR